MDRRETRSLRGPDKTAKTPDKSPDKKSADVADTSGKPLTKDGETKAQSPDPGQGIADSNVAASQNGPVLGQPVATGIDATMVPSPEDAKAAAASDTAAAVATSQDTSKSEDDAEVPATTDAKAPEVAAAVIVAVALPAPDPAAANLVAEDAPARPADATVIGTQASAPAAPADSTPAEATLAGVTPATTDPDDTPAKPVATGVAAGSEPIGDLAAPTEAQSAAVPKGQGVSPSSETKPHTDDDKVETGKPTSGRSASIAHDASSHPSAEKVGAKSGQTAQQQPQVRGEPLPNAPAESQSHPQSIEHASLTARAAVAAAHSELPAIAAAPAQLNAATPNVPFMLAAPGAIPLPNPWAVTALRVDASADNAVPVAGLAVEIVSRAQDGLRRFDIRLDPPELGRIDVRLDVDSGGKVTSRLTVERAETLDLLRRDAPQLERALQHAGLNTEGGLEFSLRDQNFAGRDQAPRDVPATARLIVPDDEQVAADAARRGYGRLIGLGGGVDIRV